MVKQLANSFIAEDKAGEKYIGKEVVVLVKKDYDISLNKQEVEEYDKYDN